MSLSTHVLDATGGQPAVGVGVRVERRTADGWRARADAVTVTDADGRALLGEIRAAGVYRICFDTGAYFAAAGVATFYPEVSVTFTVADPAAHYHVPLLLSPFAYSTYRGS